MRVTRRELALLAAGGALEASCGGRALVSPAPIPDPGAPACIPGGARRMELASFDEVHREVATVYQPRGTEELRALLCCLPRVDPRRPDGRGPKITFRGGGQSLDSQALNHDIVVLMTDPAFSQIQAPRLDAEGYYMTTGAGARWWDVVKTTAAFGLMPPSVATAGDATVGGTLSADCVSRMSPVYGKEGRQIRSFKLVLSNGCELTCGRKSTGALEQALFNAVIGGFGYLGAVTEVTFDLVPARSNPAHGGLAPTDPRRHGNPTVFTRSTRYGPNVDWHQLLLNLRALTAEAHELAEDGRGKPSSRAETPEWSALSVASFMSGSGLSANLLQQRFQDPQPLRPAPGGVYDKDSRITSGAQSIAGTFPTWIELGLTLGFPEGEFVDELFGYTFFLGNSTKLAKLDAARNGSRVNFTQQSFALPAGADARRPDTRPMRRFIELLEARLHAADRRPATIDFLYVPADEFLLSASRDFTSFVVTVSFCDRNRLSVLPEIDDLFRDLSHDCLRLGGRVHLVKNVLAEAADLRVMHGDAAAKFKQLKRQVDPDHRFVNEFFSRVFEA